MPTLPGDNTMAQNEIDYQRGLLNLGREYQFGTQQSPFGSVSTTIGPDGRPTQTTQYDPRLMQDYWNQVDQRQSQRNLFGITTDQYAQQLNRTGGYNSAGAGAPMQVSQIMPSGQMTGFDRDNFINIPGAQDFSGERQNVEDALYGGFTARADKRYGQEQTALEEKLRNQGFTMDDQAYKDELNRFGEGKTDAYQAAARDAQTGATGQQSQMLADALRIRNQQGAEGTQDYNMYNQAANSNFAQRAAAGQFQNQARQQRMGEYAQDFTLPANLQAASQLPQGTMLPNMGSGQFQPFSPNAPSMFDMTRASTASRNAQNATNMGYVNAGLGIASQFIKPGTGGGGGYGGLDSSGGFDPNGATYYGGSNFDPRTGAGVGFGTGSGIDLNDPTVYYPNYDVGYEGGYYD